MLSTISGLCGSTRLIDIGGVPHLLPTPLRDRVYEMKALPGLTDYANGSKDGFVIGAGAGDWTFLNRD